MNFDLSQNEQSVETICACWFPATIKNTAENKQIRKHLHKILMDAIEAGTLPYRSEISQKDNNFFIPDPDGRPHIPNMQPITTSFIKPTDLNHFIDNHSPYPLQNDSLITTWLNLPGNKPSPKQPIDEPDNDELTLFKTIEQWFRYEPKTDSKAATLKTRDEKQRITKLLKDGINTGELETRLIIKQLPPTDVHPNPITGKHNNPRDQEIYRGLAFARPGQKIESPVINVNDLARFLRAKREWPPEDSPLVSHRLSKLEQPDTGKQTVETTENNQVSKQKQREKVLIAWMNDTELSEDEKHRLTHAELHDFLKKESTKLFFIEKHTFAKFMKNQNILKLNNGRRPKLN